MNSKYSFILLGFIALLIPFSAKQFLKAENTQTPFFNENYEQKVCYFYAPGLMGTPLLMGRYCPSFTANTGEQVVWQNAGHVIGNPYFAVTFPETYLHNPDAFTINPIWLITNSLRNDFIPLIGRIFQDNFNFKVLPNPANKLTVINYDFDFSQANIAQSKDIRAFCQSYKECLNKFPDYGLILYGDSRGAATIFNYLATHRPTKVKAAIMEGIFDTVPHCIKHFLYIDKDKRAENRLHDLLALVMRSYNKNGPFPRDYCKSIPYDIPMLLVTSLKDGLVSPQCTISLYKQLMQLGHKKVHLLILNNSLHPLYMLGKDKDHYESTVHAFYKFYGLPYNEQKAREGLASFKNTQPNPEELLSRYKLDQCPLCKV